MSLFSKLKGDGATVPPRVAIKNSVLAWLGGFLAIASVTGN